MATSQDDANFGRILTAYGGIFVAGSLAWGIVADGFRPDRYDLIGAAVCLVGVGVIMFAPGEETCADPLDLEVGSNPYVDRGEHVHDRGDSQAQRVQRLGAALLRGHRPGGPDPEGPSVATASATMLH